MFHSPIFVREVVEVIVDDDNGLVAERTIAYRPYPALKIFRDRGIANPALKKFFPDDLFDYPENLAKHQERSEVGVTGQTSSSCWSSHAG